ncbi:11083_t:CDS:2 [Ambispora gerdemannii]|uniref:11083_t:CDS:1 n=1 Tax=Ambispora gerdemannii TaxID=144530 RepID=A0A9N8V0D4_9GLOM|nr:11083_t:CDS:2 [Ambispora gerdemannii]
MIKNLLEFGTRHLVRGISRKSDLVVDKACGVWIWTVDGRKYMDLTTGIGVTSTGHNHPKVVKAVQAQAANLIHAQVNIVLHKPMLDLVTRLIPVMPSRELDSFFFTNSGAEAVENSIKLARTATKKQNIIVFTGSYHGRTIGTMALTTSNTIYKAGFGPLMTGVHVAPYPYCIKCPVHRSSPKTYSSTNCCSDPITQLQLLLKQQTAPQETAAVIVEPILGEGGYVAPPADFLGELRKICTKNNILLIADEVQCGFGRTGKMFAVEHYNVVPDILVMAKGIASGFPLSAIATRKELADTQTPGSMGGTYAGNAVSCAAASATLDVFKEEKILENHLNKIRSAQIFGLLKTTITPLFQSTTISLDIRGLGLMVGIEFQNAPPGFAAAITTEALEKHDLILLTTSIYETLRIIPPLNITKEEVEDGMQRLEKAVKSVVEKWRSEGKL